MGPYRGGCGVFLTEAAAGDFSLLLSNICECCSEGKRFVTLLLLSASGHSLSFPDKVSETVIFCDFAQTLGALSESHVLAGEVELSVSVDILEASTLQK